MTYAELIEKVLNGGSVNAKAKELGLPQKTLDQYVKATHLPDCERAILLANAAGVSVEEAVYAIAEKKAELRPERAASFLRPAMASILSGIVAVNLFLTPTPSQGAPALTSQCQVICIMSNRINVRESRLKLNIYSSSQLAPSNTDAAAVILPLVTTRCGA